MKTMQFGRNKKKNGYLRCCHTQEPVPKKYFELYRKELFEAFDLVHNDTGSNTLAIEELQQGGIGI